ncbi:unnamed protein product, partial [Pylaiella littoralis]
APTVFVISTAAATNAAVDEIPSTSALEQPTVNPSTALGAHLPSAPSPPVPLISSRTRARTAAASSTSRARLSNLPPQPLVTIVPRPQPPARLPRQSRPTPATPRLPGVATSASLA